MDQLRPPGKLDEVKQAKRNAACWRTATCRLKGLMAKAGSGDAPGLPEAWQRGGSPSQAQLRRLRLGRKTCKGCAPRPAPTWAVIARMPGS